jgi:hypothetical protein
LGVEHAFRRVGETIATILGIKQSVDSLERSNRQMARDVEVFRASQAAPPPAEEAAILVCSADGKGIPMRRAADQPPIVAHRKKGQKANRKRMATVGTIYSIASTPRTPAEVVESLFRDPKQKDEGKPKKRPQPQHKHVWSSLAQTRKGAVQSGRDVVFAWLAEELQHRNPGQQKPTVIIMDGQESLWKARRAALPQENTVEILDLLHVTPRLWEAAHVFHPEGSAAAPAFVRYRVHRVLEGAVGYVLGGIRQMASKAGLKGAKRKKIQQICGYLEKNRKRMRYQAYLAAGYPIASGVIEGACRHLIKDRMERAGMHWTEAGAQAMLDLRSTCLNEDWTEFQNFRIRRETERLYPDSKVLKGVTWALAV